MCNYILCYKRIDHNTAIRNALHANYKTESLNQKNEERQIHCDAFLL